MKQVWRGAAIVGLLAGAACAKSPPRVPTQPTALDIPLPPPRVLLPVVLSEPVEAAAEEPEPVAATPATPRSRNASTVARPQDKPATPAAAAPEPPASQPVLQTTADVSALQERIRKDLAEAEYNLNRLKPQELNTSARAQYDQARGFIRQARDAERIRNFLYAGQLARKAAVVAGQLVKS
jgi:hypothetical protein